MNTHEAMALLAKAGQYDPTIWPADADNRQLKAATWAETLPDVPVEWAMRHITAHYKRSRETITVSDLYREYRSHGSGDEAMACNPIIVDARHDPEGRYEVWCRACGYGNSEFASTLAAAQAARDRHTPRFAPKPPSESMTDWSEARNTPSIAADGVLREV